MKYNFFFGIKPLETIDFNLKIVNYFLPYGGDGLFRDKLLNITYD